MRTLKLTDKELAALRTEYCGGMKYPDQRIRSSVYDTIEKEYQAMQQGKPSIDDAVQHSGERTSVPKAANG